MRKESSDAGVLCQYSGRGRSIRKLKLAAEPRDASPLIPRSIRDLERAATRRAARPLGPSPRTVDTIRIPPQAAFPSWPATDHRLGWETSCRVADRVRKGLPSGSQTKPNPVRTGSANSGAPAHRCAGALAFVAVCCGFAGSCRRHGSLTGCPAATDWPASRHPRRVLLR